MGKLAHTHFHLTVPIFSFLTRMHSYVGSWVCTHRPAGGHLPKDVARREANHANNERW
jgi:hypothetical protein